MSHTLIIAEAGVNHNGSLSTAKRLVDAAAEAGVDIIKFQTFKAERLVSKDAKKADYQKRNIGDGDDSQLAMLKSLELSEADHYELVAYCREKGIRFWSTAFDMESLVFLHSLNLRLSQILSGEITNYPFIKKIASFGEPVIMSTGMCDEDDIRNAMAVLTDNGLRREQITILHCNTQYPTPMADVNLRAMLTIKRDFGVEVGYSDHTQGIEVPIAAVARRCGGGEAFHARPCDERSRPQGVARAKRTEDDDSRHTQHRASPRHWREMRVGLRTREYRRGAQKHRRRVHRQERRHPDRRQSGGETSGHGHLADALE